MFKQKVYHGTLKTNSDKIKQKGFYLSNKDIEWLGKGAYFFDDFEWACKWAIQESKKAKNTGQQPAVLSADIESADNEFYDLDIKSNMIYLEKELKPILTKISKHGHTEVDQAQLRCLACNFFRQKHNIKIYAYTFPRVKENTLGFPINTPQRQFCVSNKDNISNIRDVNRKKEEVADYAI